MDARAFAFGEHVAFADAPTLHDAAHEAAHVVQQRAGVALSGGIDQPGDAHEQHAEAVADAVVRGDAAAPLLDAIAKGGNGQAVVQRAPAHAATAAKASRDDGPPTVAKPHAKWPVFAETGRPYKIVSASDPVRFWTVSDWIRSGAGFKADGDKAHSPACAAEILGALGWIPKDRIALAAQYLIFDVAGRVHEGSFTASAYYFAGLPSRKPVVSRVGSGMVQVATPFDDPNVRAGTVIEPDDARRLAVIGALAEATGLKPVSGALDEVRNDPRPWCHQKPVGSGVLLWDVDEEAGNAIFGFDETSDSKGPYSRWLRGNKKQPKKPDAPKFELHDYYGEPIPGTLQVDRELVEAGHPIWLKVAVTWPKDTPRAEDYEVKPMVTPGHGGDLVALLDCEWQFDLVGGTSASSAPSTPAKATPQRSPTPAGAASAGATSTPAATHAPSAPATAAAPSSAPAVSSAGTARTSIAELHHAFVLPPKLASGTYAVTVRASCDAYFEPAEFTKTIEVKSTAAAMKQLRGEAFADLGTHELTRTPESFDASGSGDDNHGWRTTGELPPSFKPSTLDGPDPRAAAREDERKRLEATKVYLQANGAPKDVLDAVDREIAASRATEAALAADRNKGWQPFQIRGTYLSREDGVPSGPLTLYGSVHSEYVPGLRAHGEQVTPSGEDIVVQIRDLSRRFDNQDMTFTGHGQTFEEALKAAFLDDAKAYPAGVMAIEAEAIDASATDRHANIGKGNGKTIGFELGTDSR